MDCASSTSRRVSLIRRHLCGTVGCTGGCGQLRGCSRPAGTRVAPVDCDGSMSSEHGSVLRLNARALQHAGRPGRLCVPEQAIARFRQDGVVVIDNLVDEAGVEQLKQQAAQIAKAADPTTAAWGRITVQVEPAVVSGEVQPNPGGLAQSVRKLAHLAFHDSVFERHARRPATLDVIEALMGTPDLKLYQDQLFMKPAIVGSRQSVHQDQPLGFHIEPVDLMVTAWLALDASTVATGAVRMMPGTHRKGVVTEEEKQAAESASLVGKATEWAIELEPGSVSFHHGHILHSSRVNLSPVPRWGLATHYVSAHCRFTGDPDTNDAMLVRGASMPGHI